MATTNRSQSGNRSQGKSPVAVAEHAESTPSPSPARKYRSIKDLQEELLPKGSLTFFSHESKPTLSHTAPQGLLLNQIDDLSDQTLLCLESAQLVADLTPQNAPAETIAAELELRPAIEGSSVSRRKQLECLGFTKQFSLSILGQLHGRPLCGTLYRREGIVADLTQVASRKCLDVTACLACYEDLERGQWPQEGRHILATFDDDCVVVYQAYNDAIADWAVEHQSFGGPAFNANRMTWIKTNFMWMMHRSGWGEKNNQQRILAVTLSKHAFESILADAWPSSYDDQARHLYRSEQDHKTDKKNHNVVLQWDPDHDPSGSKLERRAIQLGLRPDVQRQFYSVDTGALLGIQDITPFVRKAKEALDAAHAGDFSSLRVPAEKPYEFSSSKGAEAASRVLLPRDVDIE